MNGAALRRPHFFQHVLLLWRVRLDIGLNRGRTPNRVLAVGSFLASCAPAVGLGLAFYRLLTSASVAASSEWSRFFLNILCFVSAAVWTTWPLLSAGVDDHSELSRYAAFPISGLRLLFASSAASLLEPRSIVIYSPVVGAVLGYARVRPPSSWALLVLLFLAYLFLNAAWGRVGLHIVLNVLRQKRSAEMIGGFFVAVLTACAFIPPIDTTWLQHVGDEGLQALNLDVLRNATAALGRVPPGFLGRGVALLGAGRQWGAALAGVGMAGFAAVGFALAYRLLAVFHRQSSKAELPRQRDPSWTVFARTHTRWLTLVAREALDLWNNPKARLMAAVPFLLAILLRLVSARGLIAYLTGATADAWLLGFLCLYGAVVMCSTFSQNTFAYDGHGMRVFLSAPVDLRQVLSAKNLVHGGAAAALALAVAVFYAAYFRTGAPWDWACAAGAVAGMLPVLLAAGNLLSLYFPVRFHASLQRRDRLPFAASMFGVTAATLGAAPFVLSLQADGRRGASPHSALQLGAFAVAAWAAYFVLRPRALSLLERRREDILRAVTRE